MIYDHACEVCGRQVRTSKRLFRCACLAQPKAPSHWPPIHQYAVERHDSWNEIEARKVYADWCDGIPKYSCDCAANWTTYTAENPPDFASAEAFFAWSVDAHNFVSVEHAQPRKRFMPLMEAEGLYRVPWVSRKPRGMIAIPPGEKYRLPAIQELGAEVGKEFITLGAYAAKIGSELILLGDEINELSVRLSYAWHFNRLLWGNSNCLIETDSPDVLDPRRVPFDINSSFDFYDSLDQLFCYFFVVEEVDVNRS